MLSQKKTNEDENSVSSSGDIKFNPPLYIQRYQKVFDILSQSFSTITKVVDFGCAEGKFLRRLKKLVNVEEISCVDCDQFCVEQCLFEARPLTWDLLFGRHKALKLNVFKGSVGQRDSRLIGYDAITCIELIEHLSDDLLKQMSENIFSFIKPKAVIITTPNIQYNVVFNELKQSSKLRHWDHKFEWSRSQFDSWCQSIVKQYPEYCFETTGVGEPPNHLQNIGFCTQIAIFTKNCDSIEIERSFESYLNYELIDSFTIEKSREQPSLSEDSYVDWDLALN